MKLWQLKIVAVFLVLAGLFFWHKHEVNTAVNKAVNAEKVQYERDLQELKIKSLKVESQLSSKVLEVENTKNAQIKDVNRRYASALNSLRQHKEGSSTSSNTDCSCNSESPRETIDEGLLRRHAEISLGIARDAEELKQHLLACYTQYETVKNQLDNYKK